jgi:hypothetical protein
LRRIISFSLVLLATSLTKAQTINPNQIRPGTNGQCIITASSVAQWGSCFGAGNYLLLTPSDPQTVNMGTDNGTTFGGSLGSFTIRPDGSFAQGYVSGTNLLYGITNFRNNVNVTGAIKQNGNNVCDSSGTVSGCGGMGGVSSVGLTMPNTIFSVSGSPVTSSGTIAVGLASQSAAQFFAAPSGGSGVPAFRGIVGTDLPQATNTTFGAVKPDNTTITVAGGVISATATPAITQINGDPSAHQTITGAGTVSVSSSGGTTTITGAAVPGPMGPAGPSHSVGLVPDPGVVAGKNYVLRDDASWARPQDIDPFSQLYFWPGFWGSGDSVFCGEGSSNHAGSNGAQCDTTTPPNNGWAYNVAAALGGQTKIIGHGGYQTNMVLIQYVTQFYQPQYAYNPTAAGSTSINDGTNHGAGADAITNFVNQVTAWAIYMSTPNTTLATPFNGNALVNSPNIGGKVMAQDCTLTPVSGGTLSNNTTGFVRGISAAESGDVITCNIYTPANGVLGYVIRALNNNTGATGSISVDGSAAVNLASTNTGSTTFGAGTTGEQTEFGYIWPTRLSAGQHTVTFTSSGFGFTVDYIATPYFGPPVPGMPRFVWQGVSPTSVYEATVLTDNAQTRINYMRSMGFPVLFSNWRSTWWGSPYGGSACLQVGGTQTGFDGLTHPGSSESGHPSDSCHQGGADIFLSTIGFATKPFNSGIAFAANCTGGCGTMGQSFTTPLTMTSYVDSARGWNPTTYGYTIPTTGTYDIVAHVRLQQSSTGSGASSAGTNFAFIVGTSMSDTVNVQWHTVPTGANSPGRQGSEWTDSQHFNAGDVVSLYGFYDNSTPATILYSDMKITFKNTQ